MNPAGSDRHIVSAGGFDAPQPTPALQTAAARQLILGLSVAFAVSVIAIGQFVVSSAPAALNLSPAYRVEVQPEIVCSVAPLGVCKMREQVKTREKVWNPPDWMTPLPDRRPLPVIVAPPAEPVFNADDFTEPQMLAMMQMSDQLRHQAIWHSLRQNYEVPPFSRATFLELRDRNIAVQPEGLSFHRLTDDGRKLSSHVADYLQHKFNVHQHFMLGRIGPTVAMNCTCGWGCGLRAGDNMALKASRAMSTHLRTIERVKGLATALAPPGGATG